MSNNVRLEDYVGTNIEKSFNKGGPGSGPRPGHGGSGTIRAGSRPGLGHDIHSKQKLSKMSLEELKNHKKEVNDILDRRVLDGGRITPGESAYAKLIQHHYLEKKNKEFTNNALNTWPLTPRSR
ncbi:hypothetical protein CCP3SC1AL1_320021 [Gammaproteobacteria bacterium]